jgi:hypothetical protein
MEAIAHNSAFAKKAGVSQSVGKDFSAADKGKKFTGMKGGGRTRRFDEGGDISDEQANWLKKADRTDPIIMARMRAAVPDRPRATPASVEERNVNRVGSTVGEPEVSPPPRALPPTANTPAPISEEIKDETGKVSNIRRNLETGDLYNSVGGPSKRAAAPVPKPKPKPYTSAQDVPGYLEKAYPKKLAPMAETNAGAVTGRVAPESKYMPSDKVKEERGDRGATMIGAAASMLPFGRLVKGAKVAGDAALPAVRKVAGEYIPAVEKKLKTIYDSGKNLSGANPKQPRLAPPSRGLESPPRRLEGPKAKKPRPDEDLDMVYPDAYKRGGKVGPNMKKGGMPMESKDMVRKEVDFFKKKSAPKSMIAHEKAEMKGYAKGGGIESRGKTKGAMVRMATGGSVSSASRRADGIAQRGKTRC